MAPKPAWVVEVVAQSQMASVEGEGAQMPGA